MRRRNSKSTNNQLQGIASVSSGGMAAPRRGRRINGRGSRLAKISALERGRQQVPVLRLTGNWLAQAGFEIGQPIEIEVQQGKLTIVVNATGMEQSIAASG